MKNCEKWFGSHNWDKWELKGTLGKLKPIPNSFSFEKVVKLVQSRKCKDCGYTQTDDTQDLS